MVGGRAVQDLGDQDPVTTDDRKERVGASDPVSDDIDEIGADINAVDVDVDEDVIATETPSEILGQAIGRVGYIVATIADKNSQRAADLARA